MKTTVVWSYRFILDYISYWLKTQNWSAIFDPEILETVHDDPIFNTSKCYNFALSIFRFVLAGCFSQWYWTQSKDYKYLRQQPLFLSFGFVLKNFGTLASGSIFMTVFVVSQARAPRTTRPNSARRELPWAVRWALDKAFMAFWKVKYEYDITAAELGAIMAFTIVFMCLKRNGLEWFSKIYETENFSKTLESILKYWTTNSYILCAMYGENLFETISQARDHLTVCLALITRDPGTFGDLIKLILRFFKIRCDFWRLQKSLIFLSMSVLSGTFFRPW